MTMAANIFPFTAREPALIGDVHLSKPSLPKALHHRGLRFPSIPETETQPPIKGVACSALGESGRRASTLYTFRNPWALVATGRRQGQQGRAPEIRSIRETRRALP